MKITHPENVKKIINTLMSYGHEAYAVGGCVRDSLMGKIPSDWDITTSATPQEMLEIFKSTGIKTIPTGLKHGTVSLLLDGEIYECTTYRTEGEYSDRRHPDYVEFTKNLRDDLSRRDFTVNALASSGENICDFFGGICDLEGKIIRCVGNPEIRFSEDALRILRALRFATVLGFEIEEKTLCAINSLSGTLSEISNERKTSELSKMLVSDNPERGVKLLFETGVMREILPDAKYCEFDFLTPPDFALRLSELMLRSYARDLSRLCLSNKEKSCIKLCLSKIHVPNDEYGARKLLSERGEYAKYACLIQGEQRLFRLFDSDRVTDAPVKIKNLAIDGNDLKEMGISARKIGEILELLLDGVLKNPENNTREILLKLAKNYENE